MTNTHIDKEAKEFHPHHEKNLWEMLRLSSKLNGMVQGLLMEYGHRRMTEAEMFPPSPHPADVESSPQPEAGEQRVCTTGDSCGTAQDTPSVPHKVLRYAPPPAGSGRTIGMTITP